MNSIVNFDHKTETPPILLGFLEDPFDYMEFYMQQDHFRDLSVDQLVRLISWARTELAFNLNATFTAIYWDLFYASEGMSEERILLEANENFQQHIASYIDWLEWRFAQFQERYSKYHRQAWIWESENMTEKVQRVEKILSHFTTMLTWLTHEMRLAPERKNFTTMKMVVKITKESIKKLFSPRITWSSDTSTIVTSN